MKAAITRTLRRAIPSVSTLTYGLLGRAADLAGAIAALPFAELRALPPNRMRIRVGVGNRMVFNHAAFAAAGKDYWMHWLAAGYVHAGSDVLEIGCGCGRIAQHLKGWWFTGRYTGVDVDGEMLAHCRRTFPADRFAFVQSPHASTVYRGGRGGLRFELAPAQSVDFVYATSLLTHLLEPELDFYLAETARVLRPGGTAFLTFFSTEHSRDGARYTFTHRIGNAHVENLRHPEAAVAYDNAFILERAKAAGFSDAVIVRAPSWGQPVLLLSTRRADLRAAMR